MRRSIPHEPPILLVEDEPTGGQIPVWAVLAVVIGGAALLMALVFLVLTYGGSPGPTPIPGRGVSTYGPPSAELRVVG